MLPSSDSRRLGNAMANVDWYVCSKFENNHTNWTPAFGIFVGYAADLAFYHVPDQHGITGLNWRLMMGSACLPAIIVVCFVFLCPESPRWYMSNGRHESE